MGPGNKENKDLGQIKQLSEGAILGEWYGVGKSTISEIDKNTSSILSFRLRMTATAMSKLAKIMMLEEDVQHEETVYIWL